MRCSLLTFLLLYPFLFFRSCNWLISISFVKDIIGRVVSVGSIIGRIEHKKKNLVIQNLRYLSYQIISFIISLLDPSDIHSILYNFLLQQEGNISCALGKTCLWLWWESHSPSNRSNYHIIQRHDYVIMEMLDHFLYLFNLAFQLTYCSLYFVERTCVCSSSTLRHDINLDVPEVAYFLTR